MSILILRVLGKSQDEVSGLVHCRKNAVGDVEIWFGKKLTYPHAKAFVDDQAIKRLLDREFVYYGLDDETLGKAHQVAGDDILRRFREDHLQSSKGVAERLNPIQQQATIGRSEQSPPTVPMSDQQHEQKDDPVLLPVLQNYQARHIDGLVAFGQRLRDRIAMPDPTDSTSWSQGGVSTAVLWQRFGLAPNGTFPKAIMQDSLFDSFQEHLSSANWLAPLEGVKKVLPTYATQLEAVIAEVSTTVGQVFQTDFAEQQLVARAAFMTQWVPRLELVEGNVRVQPVNQEWEVIFFSHFITRQTKTKAEALRNQLLTCFQNFPEIQGLRQLRELHGQLRNLTDDFKSGISDARLPKLLISTRCSTLCI